MIPDLQTQGSFKYTILDWGFPYHNSRLRKSFTSLGLSRCKYSRVIMGLFFRTPSDKEGRRYSSVSLLHGKTSFLVRKWSVV